MEITTLFGIAFGFGVIILAILQNGFMGDFIDPASVLIVLGGVVASTAISYPLSILKNLGKIIGKAFKVTKVDFQKSIDNIVQIANVARREGILALEETVKEMNDPFMQRGIMLIIDGSDPELVKSVLETDLLFIRERHSQGQAVLAAMSAYAPAHGMIGTLVGLVNMLRNLDDMASLGPNMATAMITTFYGVILAQLIFTPLAKKLAMQTSEESLAKEMVLEGILSIQAGENPRIIREKLNAFLPQSQIQAEGTKKEGAE